MQNVRLVASFAWLDIALANTFCISVNMPAGRLCYTGMAERYGHDMTNLRNLVPTRFVSDTCCIRLVQTLVQNKHRQMAAKAHKVALRSSLTDRNNIRSKERHDFIGKSCDSP